MTASLPFMYMFLATNLRQGNNGDIDRLSKPRLASYYVMRQLKKFVYWRSKYSLTMQKLIENYDLRQLNKIISDADLKF